MKNVNRFPNLKAMLNCLALLLLPIIILSQSHSEINISERMAIEGNVLTKKGYWSSDRTTIYTVNWIKPGRIFNGNSDFRDSIPIITLGGITEEGGLVVTHASSFHKGYQYLIEIQLCEDCISEFPVYLPTKIIAEFQHQEFVKQRLKWSNNSRFGNFEENKPCSQGDASLNLSFSNVVITSMDNQEIEGYIDIKAKTNNEAKILYDLFSEIKYESNVFGQYGISNQNISIAPTDPIIEQYYSSISQDQTFEKASFSIIKNVYSASNALIINTFFQSTIRISFNIETTSITSLPQQLNDLLQLQNLNAAYFCNGKRVPFDRINISENPIGVIISKTETGITYTINDVEFIPPDKYQFTVFAESEELTFLRQSILRFDYSTFTFFPNQVTGGYATILEQAGTIATDYPDYNQLIQDDGNGTYRVIIGDANVPGPSDEFAALVSFPQPLVRLEMTTQNCDSNPMLAFQEFEMQGISYYYDEDNFPFFIMAYEPVFANDNQQIHPCGCNDPDIGSFTPDEIVAGDNQILTITGTNFGVYQRDHLNPGDNGTGSSVLFKNGDFVTGGSQPEYIAASENDFIMGVS